MHPPSAPAPPPPLPPARPALRLLWIWCLIIAVVGGVGGPALAGVVGAAVFIRKRAGRRVGWFALVLEPIVLLTCAAVCGLELFVLWALATPPPAWIPEPTTAPVLLVRSLVGLFFGALLGSLVGWAIAPGREELSALRKCAKEEKSWFRDRWPWG